MLGEIPFVDNENARFVRRDDGVGEALVDLAYRNRGIDQKQDDVRSVYGSRRSRVGVELDVVGDLVLLADACRIDGDKGSAVSFEAHVDTVTRRTRNFADDDALLPGECVDKRALTGVALADQCDLHHRFGRFLVTNTSDPLGHEIDQLSSAVTVKGAHGNRLAESQAYELTDLRIEMGLVDLVGYKLNALAAPPQQVSRRAVQGGNALATVHHKKDQIGLIDGEAHLSLDVFAEVITVDDAVPFNIYGGLQDNGSWYGPSTVWENKGILNAPWRRVGGGDGFSVMPDRGDPDNFGYSMSLGGNLRHFNKNTGARRSIRPVHPDGTALRFNWNAGLTWDPLDPGTIFLGSQFLHTSSDQGRSWRIISPDLTTNDITKQQVEFCKLSRRDE